MIRRMLPLTVLVGLLLSPQPGQASWEEGVAAFRAGNFSQAAQHFEKLTQERTDCAQCFLMYGQSLLALERTAQAVAPLRKAYDMNPNEASVWLPLAQAYMGVRRYDDAVSLLNTIDVNALPKARQPAYYQLRAAALTKTGRGEQAVDDLRRAAQASPQSAAAQFAYGSAALAARDTDAAIPALQAAVRLDNRDPDKRRALVRAHLLKGRQVQTKQAKQAAYRQAAEAAEQLVASSASYDHLMLLGEAQLGARQFEAAIPTFERASKANSSDWLALFYLAQARSIQGQYAQAERDLKAALPKAQEAENQTRIWRQLGFVYERQKNYGEAKTAYNRGGDANSIARIEENERIERENEDAELHNQRVQELEEQRRRLEEEMRELPPSR